MNVGMLDCPRVRNRRGSGKGLFEGGGRGRRRGRGRGRRRRGEERCEGYLRRRRRGTLEKKKDFNVLSDLI